MKIKQLLFIGMITLVFTGCKEGTKASDTSEAEKESDVVEVDVMDKKLTENKLGVFGNYVSMDYDKKDEGYDWVAVSVADAGPNKLQIKVRSRADKKKPTCTFDAIAEKENDSTYISYLSGKKVIYTFDNSQISIKTENKDDEGALFFYCSGGGTVAGIYDKIEGPLDLEQIDKTLYHNVLDLQGVGFNVSSIEKGGQPILTVMPFGLEISNDPVSLEINGTVTNAEIEDLNADGSPELLVYTQTREKDQMGNVYGFTTNAKKSMGLIYYPPITENKELKVGYEGHDEFAIVETSLVQRFPIYKDGEPTGKIRQISYKLEDGEAMRALHVDKVNEY